MSCSCHNYLPLELDRESVSKRIKETPSIKGRLVLVGSNDELRLELLRCKECGQCWQTGHEWNFADKEYLFQVPEIGLEDWMKEPFAQPAAMMIYSAVMEHFFANTRLEQGTIPCRIPECGALALRLSVFCIEHHIESLQKIGSLAKKPIGRMFPPYFIRKDS